MNAELAVDTERLERKVMDSWDLESSQNESRSPLCDTIDETYDFSRSKRSPSVGMNEGCRRAVSSG